MGTNAKAQFPLPQLLITNNAAFSDQTDEFQKNPTNESHCTAPVRKEIQTIVEHLSASGPQTSPDMIMSLMEQKVGYGPVSGALSAILERRHRVPL